MDNCRKLRVRNIRKVIKKPGLALKRLSINNAWLNLQLVSGVDLSMRIKDNFLGEDDGWRWQRVSVNFINQSGKKYVYDDDEAIIFSDIKNLANILGDVLSGKIDGEEYETADGEIDFVFRCEDKPNSQVCMEMIIHRWSSDTDWIFIFSNQEMKYFAYYLSFLLENLSIQDEMILQMKECGMLAYEPAVKFSKCRRARR